MALILHDSDPNVEINKYMLKVGSQKVFFEPHFKKWGLLTPP